MLESKIVELSPQLYTKDFTFTQDAITGKKAQRTELIYTSTVTYGGWEFDADEESMNRMNRYIQLANYKFNYDISNDKDMAEAYRDNYMNTTLNWKLTDNSIQQVNIEQLIAVFKLATDNMASKWL